MADVIVTLSLTRKSGILAAAVSSLARNGLEFQSHRFVERDDADGLHVELMADGEVEDKDTLTEVLERIRGVAAVADIGVDGRSLLHDQPAEDEEVDAVPEADPEPEPDLEPREESDPEPVQAESATAATAPERAPEEPPETGATSGGDVGADSDHETERDADVDEARSGRADSSGKNPRRRSMMRRRRRFT